MDVLQELLEEIECLQCLVYLQRGEDARAAGPVPAHELLTALRLSPGELGRIVEALRTDGLLTTEADPVHPLPRRVGLTESGRAYIERWKSNA